MAHQKVCKQGRDNVKMKGKYTKSYSFTLQLHSSTYGEDAGMGLFIFIIPSLLHHLYLV